MARFDLIVIGSGILGMAHAAIAALEGRRVVLLERSTRPVGASIRNFGMVWPVGQVEGPALDRALRSRARWLSLAELAGFWASPCGSIHAARHDDEAAVLAEFAESASPARGAEWVSPDRAREICPALRPSGLVGGLWSPTELAVEPREAIRTIHAWLAGQPNVEVVTGLQVVAVESGAARAADGRVWAADAVVCCPGDDTRSLFPEVFEAAPVRRCKLQMLRTVAQPSGWSLGPHVAGGLTLRHYASFASCPSLPALEERVSREAPEFDRFGIHVMASQHPSGQLVIGDSHEYADDFGPDLSEEINDLILGYLADLIEIPSPSIADRWYGTYLKSTGPEPSLVAEPCEGVRVVTGVGGAGMTLSFGLAEEVLADLGMLASAGV